MVLVYNGEVYNHDALRAELELLGHRFSSRCDSEAVLHAYEAWGIGALDKFNGMFAFAIANPTREQWFLARDQFGIKPLYYALGGGKFAFSSEIKGLVEIPWVRKLARRESLEDFIAHGSIAEGGRRTFFTDVSKIPPGHCAVWERGELRLEPYARNKNAGEPVRGSLVPESKKTQKSGATRVKTLALLEAAIRIRLQSEVPVGTSLSGGIDSSSIVCFISQFLATDRTLTRTLGSRQSVFSAVYEGFSKDESKWIKIVTDSTRVQKRITRPTSAGLLQELEQLVRAQEEPFQSPSVYAQWCVLRLAHESVTVVLDGQGADELFGGYDAYIWSLLMDAFRRVRLIDALLITWNGRGALRSLLRYVRSSRKAVRLAKTLKLVRDNRSFPTQAMQSLDSRMEKDLRHELPLLLRYADKNSMAFSVELRVPFLDPDLVSHVLSLPADIRMANGVTKALLREAITGVVPEPIVRRRDKVGFDVPEVKWLEEIAADIESRFSGPPWSQTPLLGGSRLAEVFRKSCRNQLTPVEAQLFWRLLIAGTWLQVFDLAVAPGETSESQGSSYEQTGPMRTRSAQPGGSDSY